MIIYKTVIATVNVPEVFQTKIKNWLLDNDIAKIKSDQLRHLLPKWEKDIEALEAEHGVFEIKLRDLVS